MSARLRLFLVVLLATLASVNDAGAAPGKAFKLTSTLDGKTALPHRIQWLATVRGANAREVDFLIDGELRWVHQHLPYYYGDFSESLGTVDRGYLVTSWLEPGVHHFTVRATSTSGQTATDTVVARVLPTPDPPSALAGTWQRTVDPADAPKPGSPGAPKDTPTPAGTYKLVIDKRWIQTRNPGTFTHASVDKNTGLGYIQDTDYAPTPTSFQVWGAVSWRPFSDYLAEEGTWCIPWGGPHATYHWSVAGNTLTLTPSGSDPCRVRQFIWAGQWARVV